MISIGRAASCDVCVEVETLSKVHGYFLREPDRWLYTDYRSTNGTTINGQKVEKTEKRALADGDRLQLGIGLHALFLMPGSLLERVRNG
jgi:pSer/pThr/pTyr-binding forkhead associated (FHA) protein